MPLLLSEQNDCDRRAAAHRRIYRCYREFRKRADIRRAGRRKTRDDVFMALAAAADIPGGTTPTVAEV